ncbi:MAG: CBS domain-containing protein [Proteobacteria bacterium]|nr:CBS domain-containing protein [Pseudomonadota bacterium]
MITAEDIVSYMKKEMIHVDEHSSIYNALKIMVEKKIGAVVVKQNGSVTGLWTERDLMKLCLSNDFDLKKARIGDYISSGINTVPHTTPLNELQERFLGLYIRHVFVEKQGKIIGLISCGDAMEAGLHYKTREMEKLNSFVSLDYYENWLRPPKNQ